MFSLELSFFDSVLTLFCGFLAFTICKGVYFLKVRREKFLRLAEDVKSPAMHWLYGHLNKFSASEEGLLNSAKRAITFPKMSMMWFGPFEASLECYHPDTVEPLLSHNIPKATIAYKFLRPWIGNSILMAEGDEWKRKRRLLAPAFSTKAIESYIPVFNETLNIMIKKWKNQDGTLKVDDTVNLMALDAILRCCMSRNMDPQHESKESKEFVDAIRSLNFMIIQRIMRPYLWNDRLFRCSGMGKKFYQACDIVHKESEYIIQMKRADLEQNNNNNNESDSKRFRDFLDLLLAGKDENGEQLTDEEIRAEVDTFVFAGHDTTSSAISWTLYCLARNPKYQQRCYDELMENLTEHSFVYWSDLDNIPFVKQCILEALRLYPPITGVGRCPHQPITIQNKTVPENNNINIRIFDLHRHAGIWQDPEVYDPERFSKEENEQRCKYAFIPFSLGRRNCIGQRFAITLATVAIARVLVRYELYVDDDTPKAVMDPGVILRSKNGIFVKIRARKTEAIEN
ncbi:cytochrome P450 4A7-like [Styela clava]